MNKKALFTAGLAFGLFLAAGQAFAAVIEPAAAGETQPPSAYQQAVAVPAQPVYQQSQGYPIMVTSGALGTGNVGYRTAAFGQPQAMMLGYGNNGSWLGLMTVITTVLVWIVLIQLIFVLSHWLKKHKHD